MAGNTTTGTELAVGYVSLTTDGSKIAEEVEKEIGVAAERGGKEGAKRGGKALSEGLGKTAATLGAVTGAQLGVGIHSAMAQNDLSGTIQAQLGTTPQYAKEIAAAAGDAYASGWGGSLEEVGNTASTIGQALNELGDGGDIAKLTTQSTAMAATFDQDANAMTNAAKKMVQTGLAGSLQEANDMMAKGFQSNNQLTTDLTDSMTEYSTEFRQLGLSGADAIGLMNQGLNAGARDGDTVSDGLKEFAIIAKGMPKAAGEAFDAIGLDANKMQKAIAGGGAGAKEALSQTLDALKKIEDPVKRSTAAVGLFGPKAEDMQDALLALDPSSAAAGLGDVAGAAQSVVDNSAGWEQTMNQLSRSIYQGLGEALTPMIPTIKDFAKAALDVFGWLKDNPIITTIIIGIGTALAAAAAGMWLWNAAALANPITWIIFGILLAVGALIGIIWLLASNWDAIMNSIAVIWGGFLNWMGEIWGGFANWWNEVWGGFLNWWNEVWGGFANWWNEVWGGFLNWMTEAWGGFTNWLGEIWGGFTNWLKEIWDGFISWLSGAWTGLVNFITGIFTAYFDWYFGMWGTLIGFVSNAWNGLIAFLSQAWSGFIGWVSGIWYGFTTWLNLDGLGQSFMSTFQNVGNFIGGVFVGIQETFRAVANTIIDGLNGIISKVNGVSGAIRDATGGAIDLGHIGGIPGLATGGTVTRGGTVLVGENGPELLELSAGASVIPLDHPAAQGAVGGGNTVKLTLINPVAEKTSESIRKAGQLVGVSLV